MYAHIVNDLQNLKNPAKAKILAGFFKTGKGQYGEGDVFLGITVPVQRTVVKKYTHTPFSDIRKLLASTIHEHRFVALMILVEQYKKANKQQKRAITLFYLKHKGHINNWDLVDLSAPNILGDYFFDRGKAALYSLVNSKKLWDKRIAMLATFGFIRKKRYNDALKIAEKLLSDPHDLIHKAVGWMLREIGKRNQPVEESFLLKHYKTMPRTMLRYAIERFDKKKRAFYMAT